ncbi:MAG: TIGR01212 family radical SAM protein [Spirochaetaceae bacterium 4572_7]|nr:MAG: TIGR01212 family radical SAM protein [Spirochaetaceae bacterium 4572_7]
MEKPLLYIYSDYLKKKYGKTVYRVGVDGGFSCPNRKGGRNGNGCTFCGSFGARSAYLGDNESLMEEQIKRSIGFLKRRYKAESFILYFQAYSSTFGSVNRLKNIYDYGLSLGNFVELVVSTRPDCITDDICKLLKSYVSDGFDVWVELGLQSSNDISLERINRGHNFKDFQKAFSLLKSYGIKVTVHLIFGLPGESSSDILNSVRDLAKLKPDGVKFHNLHIPTGTVMFEEYLRGELAFPSSLRHAEYVADAVELMPPETVVMRLTTDTPGSRHSVPGYFLDKSIVYNKVRSILEDRETFQGIHYVREI